MAQDSVVQGIAEEIIKKAHDGAVPAGRVVRDALSLAEKVGDRDFAGWARREVEGYDLSQETPAYRTIPEDSIGLKPNDPRLLRALDFKESVSLRMPIDEIEAFVNEHPETSHLLIGAGSLPSKNDSGKRLLPESRWPSGIEGTYWVPCRCKALKQVLQEVRRAARDWCWKLADSPGHDQPRSTGSVALGSGLSRNAMKKMGATWEIRFHGGNVFTVRDKKGLQYIATLIKKNGEEVTPLELVQRAGDTTTAAPEGLETRADLDLGDPVMDERYLAGCAGEVEKIKARLEGPELTQDERTELIDQKRRILELLRKGQRLGGKARNFDEAGEKARKAVLAAIARAKKDIKNNDKALFAHLDESLKTGVKSWYRPKEKEVWRIET